MTTIRGYSPEGEPWYEYDGSPSPGPRWALWDYERQEWDAMPAGYRPCSLDPDPLYVAPDEQYVAPSLGQQYVTRGVGGAEVLALVTLGFLLLAIIAKSRGG